MAARGGPADGKPFAKGQSGNPGGRPKSTLGKTLVAILAEHYPGKKFSNEKALCRRMVADAIDGDAALRKELREFIWSKLEAPLAPEGGAEGGGPLMVQIVSYKGAA